MNKTRTMVRWIWLTAGVAWLLSAGPLAANDQVRVYPAPDGEPLSTSYLVTVGESKSPVYVAKVRTTDLIKEKKDFNQTAFTSFDINGSVNVTVTSPRPIQSAKILPSSSGIMPVISGNTVTFTLSKPGQLTLELNGDWVNSLHLFANPWETDIPKPDDPNVIYFGPGIHYVDEVRAMSGQTVYVAGGAIVCGRWHPPYARNGSAISLEGDNIALRGRGIIDAGLCPLHTNHVVMVHGTNISVEGVTLRDSSLFTLPISRSDHVKIKNVKVFGWRGNSDGIDIINSTNVDVSDCFLRTFDDLIVVKTDKGRGESRDINVTNCVLWNTLAHALSIGAELRENVEHVHFANCDVIHDKGREWVLRVYHCDSALIKDVTFEDIRIEESGRLISLWIGKAVWSLEKERGHIEDVTFRNIQAGGPNPLVELKGFDAEHAIKGVQFDHVVVNAKPLQAADVKQNEFVQGVTVK